MGLSVQHTARINRFCIISVATSLRSEIYSPCLRFYDKRPYGSFHFDSVMSLALFLFYFFCARRFCEGAIATTKKVSTNQLSLIQIPILDLKFHSCYDSILSHYLCLTIVSIWHKNGERPIVRCRTFDFDGDVRRMC